MPKDKTPRFKIIHCRTCGKTIRRFDRSKYKGYHVPQDEILAAIRRHYKRNHPKRFKQFAKKAVKTKKEKGLI